MWHVMCQSCDMSCANHVIRLAHCMEVAPRHSHAQFNVLQLKTVLHHTTTLDQGLWKHGRWDNPLTAGQSSHPHPSRCSPKSQGSLLMKHCPTLFLQPSTHRTQGGDTSCIQRRTSPHTPPAGSHVYLNSTQWSSLQTLLQKWYHFCCSHKTDPIYLDYFSLTQCDKHAMYGLQQPTDNPSK